MLSEEIRKIFPNTVRDVKVVSIDLDFTGMSVADILRNLNKSYPRIGHERGMMKTGKMVVCVLTKSELLYPYKGIVFMITNDQMEISAFTKKYLIFVIDQEDLSDEDSILNIVDRLTRYLVKYTKNEILKLQDFFVKYVYDLGEEKRLEEFRS